MEIFKDIHRTFAKEESKASALPDNLAPLDDANTALDEDDHRVTLMRL